MLGRVYFIDDKGYQNFLVLAPMLSLLSLDNNKKVPNWISTVISPEKNKSFDANLGPTMSNLANDRVILKFNNTLLVQKKSSAFHSNSILNLYIVYELNSWSRNSTNNLH